MQRGTLQTGAAFVIEGSKAKITGTCPFSGNPWSCIVDADQFKSWLNGTLIQNAMPGVSLEVREMLLSGMAPATQDEIFNYIPDDVEVEEIIDHCPTPAENDTFDWDNFEESDDLPF
jgi:hypothetical protein